MTATVGSTMPQHHASMQVSVSTINRLSAAPKDRAAIILHLTKLSNGVSLALDFRHSNSGKLKTIRLLERSPRREKHAIRLAIDMADITRTQNVFIIERQNEREQQSSA